MTSLIVLTLKIEYDMHMINKSSFNLFLKRLLIIGLVVIFVFVFMVFNTRVTDLFNKNTQLEKIQSEITQLNLTKQVLSTQIAYATSEVAVQDWARPERHLVQPGDYAIIPLQSSPVSSLPVTQSTPMLNQGSNWEVWRLLFFGN